MDFELHGGLGDAFIDIHTTMAYENLHLEPSTVYINSHNPFVDELFSWHPNAANIKIVKSKSFFLKYDDEPERLKNGFLPARLESCAPRGGRPVTFHPSHFDREALATLPPNFVAISPCAGALYRNLPDEIVHDAISLCIDKGFSVVSFGRSYESSYAGRLEKIINHDRVLSMVNRLSVPGTAVALSAAKGIITSHSSLLLLAWYMRKYVFAAYPDQIGRLEWEPENKFSFGKGYAETMHMPFSRYDRRLMEVFMDRLRHVIP